MYALTFEFIASDTKIYQKVLKTHITDHLEDDDLELLFYDPKDPTQSTLVDDLAGGVQVDSAGALLESNSGFPIKPFITPIVCLGPHLYYLNSLLN